MSKYGTLAGGLSSIKRARPSYKDTTMKKLTFKQRIINWLKDDKEEMYATMDAEMDTSLNSNGMRFQLYKASGGFVVETKVYDENTDRNRNKLYVITDDKDLGEELGKIITMESLR